MHRAIPLLVMFSAAGCATPLTKAARAGDTGRIQTLLAAGADINARGGHGVAPLMAAAADGKLEAVRLLVENGADLEVRATGNAGLGTPLTRAVAGGHCDVVRYLLENGAKVGPNDIQWASPDCAGLLRQRQAPRRRPQPVAQAPAEPALTPRAEVPAAPAASDVDQPAYRGDPRPDDFALVVGVEEYDRLPKATHAVRDADAVRRHLLALGFPERNIVLLKNRDAVRSRLTAYLEEWLPKNTSPQSTVIFYYSGHGAPDPRTGQAFLVPADGDAVFLRSTALPLRQVYDDLAKLPAKHVVVALDSCFSGAGGRSVIAQGARPLVTTVSDLNPGGKLSVFAAASGEEITGALDDQAHGLFTYYFLKGLSSGRRSMKSLYDYLKPHVQDEAHRQNREQTPIFSGEDRPF